MILSEMEIHNLRLDDDGPSTADIEMLYDSHEALRERVAVLTEERDGALAELTRVEGVAAAQYAEFETLRARVAVLEAGLREIDSDLAWLDGATENTSHLHVIVIAGRNRVRALLGGVPATKEEQT